MTKKSQISILAPPAKPLATHGKSQKLHNKLLQIVKKKRSDLLEQKKNRGTFKEKMLSSKNIALIAEIKLASPSISSLGSEDNIVQRAIAYEQAGADAISVITEKHFFKGDVSFIPRVKQQVTIPILQKDFVIDPYQIYEAKMIGSDAILLIARLINKDILKNFVAQSLKIGIEPIVEINDEEDLEKAVATTTSFIAVNARDLRTLTIDISKACTLLKKIPKKFIKLGFSGIHSSSEVKKYKEAGAKGVLVGTSLMKTANIHSFINDLKSI